MRFPGGPKAPLFVKTPTVAAARINERFIEKYRISLLKKLPFALTMPEALKRLASHKDKVLQDVVDMSFVDEPVTNKRKIK